jgi:hypothetical protein
MRSHVAFITALLAIGQVVASGPIDRYWPEEEEPEFTTVLKRDAAPAGAPGWMNWGGNQDGGWGGSWGGKPDKPEKPDHPKHDKPDKPGKPGKPGHPDKPNKPTKKPQPPNPKPSQHPNPKPSQHPNPKPSQHPNPKPSQHPSQHPKPPGPKPSGGGGGNGDGYGSSNYKAIVLQHHNVHRANHSAPPLKWSDQMANVAAQIASSCAYGHKMGVNGLHYGQNIAAGVPPDMISKVISDMFYNHEMTWFAGQYGKPNPDKSDFEHWGHFSQLVWKNSDAVGCHTQFCGDKGGLKNVGNAVKPFFTVCNYEGVGNIAGKYAENIGRPLGRATVHGDGWSKHK